MPKSAAVFVKAEPKGEVNYKPCEIQDEKVAAEHRRFQVEPIGRIGDYPRHIPYSSDKKSFQQRTGRDAFEGSRYHEDQPEQKLTACSIPIHVSHARGRPSERCTYHDVGLQRRPREDYGSVQEPKALKG